MVFKFEGLGPIPLVDFDVRQRPKFCQKWKGNKKRTVCKEENHCPDTPSLPPLLPSRATPFLCVPPHTHL